MPQTPKQLIRRRVKVDNLPPVMQLLAVGRPQYDPAAGGQNAFWIERELPNHRLFHITEPTFALAFEILADRAAQLLLYHMVRIKEWELKAPGKLTPDGGFSGTREADETYHAQNS